MTNIMFWVSLAAVVLWVCWAVGHYVLMMLVEPIGPSCVGNRIVMPDTLRGMLTENEFEAVLAHERGHQYYSHTWENLFLVCVFCPADSRRREQQEYEADSYAFAGGHGAALASAIKKLSGHPFDMARVEKLEDKMRSEFAWLA